MSHPYSRILRDQDQIEHFLVNVLRFDYKSEAPNIIYRIIEGEKSLVDIDVTEQTLSSTKYRDRDFKDDFARWNLREQIINELLNLTCLDTDDDIELGKGGALPKSDLKREKQAFILIGPPASGKSTIADIVSDKYGALILDPDYAKRKLPEYKNYSCGATLVHEESSKIVLGFKKEENPKNIPSLYEHSITNGYNLVLPKIGQNPKNILKTAKNLRSLGYSVHLILISLLRTDATIRAVKRFHKTGRYLPLGLVFDGYSNDPILSYYILKNKFFDDFSSFGAITTKEANPKCIDISENSPCNLFPYIDGVIF